MNKNKVLVYLESDKLSPRGGPYAVGYYYYIEMKKRGEEEFSFIPADPQRIKQFNRGQVISSKLPNWINKIQRTVRNIIRTKRLLEGPAPSSKFDFSGYDIVHFHKTIDMFTEREQLKDFKGIVILQSHSPLPLGQETCINMPKIEKRFIRNIEEKYEVVDRYAFDRADYIIFPCEEAEEPYHDNWSYFSDIKEKKADAFKYVTTGIDAPKINKDKETVLRELGIAENDFIISYVGRHNYVKGYDLLKEIGKKCLDEMDDAYCVCAGREEPYTGLDHSRWIEIGWTTDPHSYISASDVFVLPNRVTYFDIVMIEVLAIGKIVVASRTGGNKYFERMNAEGVFLYDTTDEAVEIIKRIKNMSLEERKKLENANKDFYKKYLSVSAMYDGYISTLKEIKGDTVLDV